MIETTEAETAESFDVVPWSPGRQAITGKTSLGGLLDRLRIVWEAQTEFRRQSAELQLFTISFPADKIGEVQRIVERWTR